ncbi:hypothetical protein CFBP6600_44050 [Xanthomonas arboricola pv. corylina]|uniref:Uncharacterized protein n=1 Tax=Xanthomonas arboricola pv. corylina TaxID=487821 RepID=A0A8D6VWN9_9XANT|nr:hypothetical protein CFBP1159_42240 [Xanthomonas arboricola pv. corylina]SUZ38461.1 hypothetical protein CPBF1521_44170 [Xanthomonas arboricola pv. juglandis]CAE6854962.1 hypothetical protein CFBP1159_42240 [Xanthomonas arboricola pv. corylina]CAE6861837.1 hypothetical protein XAC301_44340 [Xanthomonas arboricola pv. corylina]CAE6861846.1 hypothetical protein XAC301_44340 [Xanthomonas arboricola pv. corylina]
MSGLTDQELRAALYFAVGVSSESGYALINWRSLATISGHRC